MKTIMMKTVGVLLILLMLFSVLVGCVNPSPTDGPHSYHSLFPEGYTGGFRHQPGANIEYWWVETYEECLASIELLESHGSTFSDDFIISYDGNAFDTKYCFIIAGAGSETEEIRWGDNPFGRCAKNVRIISYAFLENVTIDEINHSLVSSFHSYQIIPYDSYNELFNEQLDDDYTIDNWIIDFETSNKSYIGYKDVLYDGNRAIRFRTCFRQESDIPIFLLTDEHIKEFINNALILNIK